jgi:hypothetical protein
LIRNDLFELEMAEIVEPFVGTPGNGNSRGGEHGKTCDDLAP